MNNLSRKSILHLLAVIAIAIAGVSTASANKLPKGVYLMGCYHGEYGIWNILGNKVADLAGPCPPWGYLRRIFITNLPAPPPPSLSPANDPAWGGKPASYWIGVIKSSTPTAPGTGTVLDNATLQQTETMPTLQFDVAHYDQLQ